jgi:hypothetical protein
MAIIRLKKGFSGVTPTGLTLAEPAFDYKDSKLYVGLTSSAVWVGAEIDNTTSLGTSQIKIPTQFAVKTYIDNLGLSPGVVVTGVNGVTGAVLLGVTSGPGLSIVNPTGSGKGITLINTGVLSVNGSTGAISNVAFTNVAQTFTNIQTFSSGITVSSASRYTGAQRFNDIRNRGNGVTLAITTDADGADLGLEAKTDIRISPYGDVVIAPTTVGIAAGGSSPRLTVENDDDANGRFIFSGGDILIASSSTFLGGGRNSNIIFSIADPGSTASITLRGITATSGANKVIQLPDHTGIVAVPANLGTSGNILRANGITAQPTWIDPSAAGFTAAGANLALNDVGGAAGNLRYQTGANTSGFVSNAGTTGFFLTYNTTSNTPTWVNPNTIGFTAYGSTVTVNIQGGANGSLPYQTAANTTTFLPIGSNLTVLRSNGTTFSWVDPTTAGFTAAGANIAVNLRAGAAGNLVYQTGASTTGFVTNSGTTGFFLTYNTTTNTPTWVNPNTIGFTAYGSTVTVNVQGGAAGSLPYNTGANTTTFLGIGANLTILRSNGSAPTWIDPTAAGFTAAGANIAVNLRAGAAGSLPYNTAASTTTFLGIGSAGTILTSTGSAPQWSTATGLTVGTAQQVSVIAETADTTTYVTFVGTNSNSNQALEYNSSLVYNAVTNYLEANIDGGSY